MKRWFFLGIVILLAGVWGVWWFLSQQKQPPSYQTAIIERGNIFRTITTTGNVDYAFKHSIYAKTGGIVTGVYVSPGNTVRSGQILAKIDDTELRISYEKLRQTLLQQSNSVLTTKKEYEDAQKLYNKQFISYAELESARINYENAITSYQRSLLELQEAINTLQNCTLVSPVSGVVALNNLTTGTNLPNSSTLAFIIASHPSVMQIKCLVSEIDIASIKKGQKVLFTVSAYTNTFTGEVSEIWYQPQTSQDVVYYPVIILTENTTGKLLPGMSVSVEIIIQGKENVLRVPSRALRIQPTQEMLATLTNIPRVYPPREATTSGRRQTTRPQNITNATQGSFATLWLINTNTKEILPLRVRTGISDGQYTEILPWEENENLEGKTIITAIRTTKNTSKTSSSQTPRSTSSQSQNTLSSPVSIPAGGPGIPPHPGF
ncbi:efflux RND transporter periplasmic adaptor subunit [Thermospira aquatica]|uniref:Efflux RND transporter periplasmic adaptor subunit n=1 Tax=Thermospira aquatica TaxID=2828656 RepID=A0AAX3BCI2_9SPIR|nr:efflux RND transporter periplasmic adaptor subunit [Thermospira aquatica]URA09714.1 efflux RND transporter periplasmic adaptor subunit [Thermospira aquatica]